MDRKELWELADWIISLILVMTISKSRLAYGLPWRETAEAYPTQISQNLTQTYSLIHSLNSNFSI